MATVHALMIDSLNASTQNENTQEHFELVMNSKSSGLSKEQTAKRLPWIGFLQT